LTANLHIVENYMLAEELLKFQHPMNRFFVVDEISEEILLVR